MLDLPKDQTSRQTFNMSERSWVHQLVPRIQKKLHKLGSRNLQVMISDGKKLAYACVIHEYDKDGPVKPSSSQYETDILVYDLLSSGVWIPRIVIECKVGGSV